MTKDINKIRIGIRWVLIGHLCAILCGVLFSIWLMPGDWSFFRHAMLYYFIAIFFYEWIYVIPLLAYAIVKRKFKLANGVFLAAFFTALVNLLWIVWKVLTFSLY